MSKLGVNNAVPEEIKQSIIKQNKDFIIAGSPIDNFNFYENILKISSWEASYTYNGKSYRFCTVSLEDKANSPGYLSHVFKLDKIVKGSLYDYNLANRFIESTIRHVAKKANNNNPDATSKVILNALLAFLPSFERPKYIIHGSDIHEINNIIVNELRYVYVYD